MAISANCSNVRITPPYSCDDRHELRPGGGVADGSMLASCFDVLLDDGYVADHTFYGELSNLLCGCCSHRGRRAGVEEQQEPVQPASTVSEYSDCLFRTTHLDVMAEWGNGALRAERRRVKFSRNWGKFSRSAATGWTFLSFEPSVTEN